METFEYFIGLVSSKILLRHADNLSSTSQKPYSASEGQSIADMTKRTLQKMRSKENFGLLKKINRLTTNLARYCFPMLPRRTKMHAKRYQVGSAPPEFPNELEDFDYHNYIF